MAWTNNIVEFIRNRWNGSAPQGNEYEWDYSLDGFRAYVSEGATFDKVKNLIKCGDAGDLATTLHLFEELEEKDWRLADAANTRRIALTGLEWDVYSAAEQQEDEADRKLADDAAAHVRQTLNNVIGFDVVLEHLATAIGSNLAVAETTWVEKLPVKIEAIPSQRLTMRHGRPEVHIITRENMTGIPAEPGKFIVHTPNNKCGFYFKGSIHRAVAALYVVKLLAMKDWSQFAQVFGMPHRVATYRKNASPEEKKKAKEALENMGSAAWALVSDAITFVMNESSNRGIQPFEALMNYCDKQQTIAFLGGHLTTDTANATGTHAAGSVQNEVRKDLRDDDIRREGRTIRDQLIVPMCLFEFQNQVVKRGGSFPFPYFGRVVPETVDRKAELEIIEIMTQRLGCPVEKSRVYEIAGVQAPELDEKGNPVNEVVEKSAPVNPFADEGDEPASRFADDEL